MIVPRIPGTRNSSSEPSCPGMAAKPAATPVPATDAIIWKMPMSAPMLPCCSFGTRSASDAVMISSESPIPNWTTSQPSRSTTRLGASAQSARPTNPISHRVAIHGRLRPSAERVRSLSMPTIGPSTTTSRAPRPVM